MAQKFDKSGSNPKSLVSHTQANLAEHAQRDIPSHQMQEAINNLLLTKSEIAHENVENFFILSTEFVSFLPLFFFHIYSGHTIPLSQSQKNPSTLQKVKKKQHRII